MHTVHMDVNETVLYNLIGNAIKRQRVKMDMTQAQLAGSVGILRTSIANIEAGRQKLPLHLLYKLCMELDMEVTDILPSNAVISQSNAITVEGTPKEMPPKTAEFLKQLLEE